MCGFAGFVGPRDPALLGRMGVCVRHRGPDQEGAFEDEGCSLAHKRLSIIDLSEAGKQPMTTANGRFVIAYNGELYNYRALRKRYEAEGWVFRTQTDTECFLASAALHALNDLDQFHGMFAFALWDAKERICYVARDRMGIKPLYVAELEDRFAFASEMGSLLELREKWSLDTVARSMYLAVGYVPAPRTMVKGIQALEPGRLFVVEDQKMREVKRFDASRTEVPQAASFNEAVELLPVVVDQAVERQLVSDRPVGVFLSGGLDSTVVLSAMRSAQPNAVIKTFTTRFHHESGDPKFNRDAELAVDIAKRYGCEHHEIEVGPEDVIREADAIAHHLGQPHANNSVPALDAAARLASQQVPVVLSGDGGDESFGGYERYRLRCATAPLLDASFTRKLVKGIASLHPRQRAWDDLLTASTEGARLLAFHAPALLRRRALFGHAADDDAVIGDWNAQLAEMKVTDPASRFMALDRATWLRDDAFVRSDRMTMRHGLEMRVPLTDDAVVAFAASLPRQYHVTSFEMKHLWKTAFQSRVPAAVLSEAKRGWFPPTAKWLRTGLKDWAHTIVEEAINTHAWMNGDAIRKALRDHETGEVYGLQEVQTVIGYQLWWRAYGHRIQDV